MCSPAFAAFKSKSSVIKTFCRSAAQAVAPLLAWMLLRERQQLAAGAPLAAEACATSLLVQVV
jgi:hypothetical protein